MTKIIIADNPLNERSVAEELLPSNIDAVYARHGSPEFKAALKDAVCLVGFGDGTMDDAFYKSAPNLKLVQLLSAGYDRCDIESARRAGVPICNNGGANAIAVAEHAMLLMLAVIHFTLPRRNYFLTPDQAPPVDAPSVPPREESGAAI